MVEPIRSENAGATRAWMPGKKTARAAGFVGVALAILAGARFWDSISADISEGTLFSPLSSKDFIESK